MRERKAETAAPPTSTTGEYSPRKITNRQKFSVLAPVRSVSPSQMLPGDPHKYPVSTPTLKVLL